MSDVLKVLVDTNIVMDLLMRREPYQQEAAELFSLGEKNVIKLAASAIVNTHYVLIKEVNEIKAQEVLKRLKILIHVLPVNNKILDLSLNSDFKDFEDAIQYFTSVVNNLEIIITRNVSDFKTSNLPVMTAGQYLNIYRLKQSIYPI